MPVTVSIHRHEHEDIVGCGNFEIRFSDKRRSHYVYFEDRRGLPATIRLTKAQAYQEAKRFARAAFRNPFEKSASW